MLSTVDMDNHSLLAKLSELLEKGLAKTAAQITADIRVDIQGLGTRIEVVEKKLQTTINCTNKHMQPIQNLQEQLDTALSKINDVEYCSGCYIRGVPN